MCDRRGKGKIAAILGRKAEELTGITKQQVSKWRRRLKEPEEYRAMLCGAA